MKLTLILLVISIFFNACSFNKIETLSTLSTEDLKKLNSLKLLDNDEKLFKFYSEYEKSVSGNFYTDKRLASYWIDEHDSTNNKVEFAFYEDIVKLDTIYNAGVTYCPYLLVTRKDNSSFKVCVEGTKIEVSSFFEEAIRLWQQTRKQIK